MSLISEPKRRSPSPERVRGYKLERELDYKERTNGSEVDTTFGYLHSNTENTNNHQVEDNHINTFNIQFNNKMNGK